VVVAEIRRRRQATMNLEGKLDPSLPVTSGTSSLTALVPHSHAAARCEATASSPAANTAASSSCSSVLGEPPAR
jgi:hypothetical protein